MKEIRMSIKEAGRLQEEKLDKHEIKLSYQDVLDIYVAMRNKKWHFDDLADEAQIEGEREIYRGLRDKYRDIAEKVEYILDMWDMWEE